MEIFTKSIGKIPLSSSQQNFPVDKMRPLEDVRLVPPKELLSQYIELWFATDACFRVTRPSR